MHTMGVAVGFDAAQIPVTPGQEASVEVRVRNTGQVVDQIDLDILGDAKAWARVEPASVNLLPGAEQAVRLVLAPPRSATIAAGETTFALRAFSHEDTEGSVIHEAVALVAPFTEIAADIVPRTSRGSRKGKHELVIDNTGNHPTMVEIRPTDPDDMLEFRVEQSVVDTQAGTASFVDVVTKPQKRFIRGQNKTLPFQVIVLPEGEQPLTVNGSMLQEAMLPKWVMVAALAVVAGLVALAAFWFALVKPTVSSTAKEAAAKENAKLAESVAAAESKAAAAGEDAAAAKNAAAAAAGDPAAAAAAASSAAAAAAAAAEPKGPADAAFAPSATDLRITTNAASGSPGTFRTFNNVPPESKLIWISDLVLQNPRGDSGILQVRRGNDVLFEVGLDNFRDLDYHFIQPVRFSHEQPVVVAVDCRNPSDACTPSVYFTGQILPEPTASTTPTG
jgi:hypothetical protein